MITSSSAAWDDALLAADGHLLQSWRWGAFKAHQSWDVERVVVEGESGMGLAQVLFKRRGPASYGYIPRGPAFSVPEPTLARDLFRAIDEVCRRRFALGLIVEPDVPLPFTGRYSAAGFVRGPTHIQPARTVKVRLGTDDELLARMHPKTKYNVRLAMRRGVTSRRSDGDRDDVATFFALLEDTARRNAFAVHAASYYRDFLTMFDRHALLIFALVDEIPVAGAIAARFGTEAVYMYGGSSSRHRAHGAAFYLQYEIMRWARENGCARYDMWGIPEYDPESSVAAGGEKLASSHGDDWRGLYEFKTRFGGDQVRYPPVLERRYHPLLRRIARQIAQEAG